MLEFTNVETNIVLIYPGRKARLNGQQLFNRLTNHHFIFLQIFTIKSRTIKAVSNLIVKVVADYYVHFAFDWTKINEYSETSL